MWASIYAGLTKVRLEPQVLIDAEEGLFQQVCELNLEFVPLDADWTATIGGSIGCSARPAARLRLSYIDDRNYRFDGAVGKGSSTPVKILTWRMSLERPECTSMLLHSRRKLQWFHIKTAVLPGADDSTDKCKSRK